MAKRTQDKFRRRVRRWLADNDVSVTALAGRLACRRDTVSKAINQGRFPLVREKIKEAILR